MKLIAIGNRNMLRKKPSPSDVAVKKVGQQQADDQRDGHEEDREDDVVAQVELEARVAEDVRVVGEPVDA